MTGDYYFESYEDLDVHRLMLDDKPRTLAYKNFIFENAEELKGKTVLDVGCGTGILSVFCAQVGAKKVYAVEANRVAKIAELVVEENNLKDVITVIHSKVEDLILDEKVDVLISEWMGFYLLHEGMLDSVIIARDKFLKPDGIIVPESAKVYVAPCQVPKFYNFWDDVFGVKMKSVGRIERSTKTEPVVMEVKNEELLGDPHLIFSLSIDTVKQDELNNISKKIVTSCKKSGMYQGLCIWFDCKFPEINNVGINLSTHPECHTTHWKQTVIVLPNEMEVEENTPVAFQVDFKRREEGKKYDIVLTLLDPVEEEHPVPCDCYHTKCIVIKAFLNKQTDENCIESDSDDEELE